MFCSQCVLLTERDPATPRCALCDRGLDYLGAGNAARPFWSVAHRFFAFPFSPSGIGSWLSVPLLAVLVSYFAVVNFAMLGYLVFEHQSDWATWPAQRSGALSSPGR